MSYRIIEASEIVEYLYCRRAWWLHRIVGRESRNVRQLAYGEAFHRRHRSNLTEANRGRQFALLLIFLAVCFVVFWLVSSS
jgi:CRISPR/Cas system-associated exonuclease Cas4 (RecB family)